MEISKGTLGAIVAVCLGAGATGAYLGSRTGTTISAPAQAAEAALPVEAPAAPTTQPSSPAPVVPIEQPSRAAAPVRQASMGRPVNPRIERPRAPEYEFSTAAGSTAPVDPPAPAPGANARTEVAPAIEVPVPIAPPEPRFEDLVVPAQSVIGLQLDSTVSSEQAQVEDVVVAHVTRDVRVAERVAIPAGARVQGFVTVAERGGRLRERARLGIRFTTVILSDGTRLPIDTEAVYREGDSAARESATKIGGGAIGGAIIGGILGGAKGAAIGSTIGAGAGTTAVMTGGRNPAAFGPTTPLTIRLEQPVTVAVERDHR